jgi:tetratricopeptide (TPR) repeat protein
MPSLGATTRGLVPVFVTLLCAGPLAAQQATTSGNQSPAVVGNATINYNNMTPEQIRQVVEQVLEALPKSVPAGGPGAEQRVDQAVTAIAKGASEGDDRLQKALSLLAAGNVGQAVPLLQAVAAEKTARIRQDSKDAAAAYRNLGAIAGLADPKKAREAYVEAARLDPSNVEGVFWHGFFEADAGNLIEAETAYRQAINLKHFRQE